MDLDDDYGGGDGVSEPEQNKKSLWLFDGRDERSEPVSRFIFSDECAISAFTL